MKHNKTLCYLSERGHRNFWYPTKDMAILTKDCSIEKLNWISGDSGRNLLAYKVPRSCLIPIKINENSMMHTNPPQTEGYTIIWIEK